jgi:hypothetical protein
MQKIYRREQAKRDLVERFVYLADNASLAIADQFLKNACRVSTNWLQVP